MFRGTLQQQTYEQRTSSALFNWEWSVDNKESKEYLNWVLKILRENQALKRGFEVKWVEFIRGIYRLSKYGTSALLFFPFLDLI